MDVLIGWPGGDWQATARLAATLVGGYLFILWATSVLWVYRDIQQRTRDPVSQLTAVAISIVFPLVSLPIYAALRPSETLQDSYLRLLEREVLLSELGEIQGGGEPRRTTTRAASTAATEVTATEVTAPVAPPSQPASRSARPPAPEPPTRSRRNASETRRAPVATEPQAVTPSKPEPPKPSVAEVETSSESGSDDADSESDSKEPLDEAIRRRI